MSAAQLCTKCSRANPPEAVYCYFDGLVLGGRERQGGPVAVGAKPFNSPFVFPSGRSCRSFDELALACQEDWKDACGLLADGYLESFFGGLGRIDLSVAAKEAARFPDVERGLDQLLAKLPGNALAEPRLRIDPLDVNLGVIESDAPRAFELEMENQGMRLVYGTLTSDAVWLTLGDAGANEKHFHFTHESRIAVRVRTDRIRAGSKPVEGKLRVESSGGALTVLVRAQKPVKAFPGGALQGARTPRQVAELAQKSPKDVAPLFEAGEVEKWYASNGWTYPVKIPAASGPAAIQQFFEALGVTRAPKVEISHRELALEGNPGDRLPVRFEVSTQEKRPVFAHVTSNVPWLEVGRAQFNGRTATVNMTVPTVPSRPGETLRGELSVVANGNQRFVVPVRLAVGGAGSAFDFDAPAPPAPPPPPPPSSPRRRDEDEDEDARPRPEKKAPPPPAGRQRRQRGAPLGIHLVPACLLALAVLGVVVYDLVGPRTAGGGGTAGPLPRITGPNYDPDQLANPKELIGVSFNGDNRFGVVMLGQDDPANKGMGKKLTYHANGSTNNTIIKIGSSEYRYGYPNATNVHLRPWDNGGKELPKPYIGWQSTMECKAEKIRVTQYLQIVPSRTKLLDTLLIYYKVQNYGTAEQKVAVRVMLDTYIGSNDGVPFTVPGADGFVTAQGDFRGDKVPSYIEAVENPDSKDNLGTIARIGLRGLQWSDRVKLLEPSRLLISKFPGDQAGWDWDPRPMAGDSCVAVYWPQQTIKAKEVRNMAMTYGLGRLDISGDLALSADEAAPPNREFTVTAYVYNAKKGEKVTLELPPGVTLTSGSRTLTLKENAKRTQVYWKVKASKQGPAVFNAVAGPHRAAPLTVKIQARSIFG
jgi:hypothetical protein